MIKIILSGKPLSTQHIYFQRGKIKFMGKDAKEKKLDYIRQIKEQYNGDVLEGNIKMKVKLVYNDKRKRDVDNYHKLSLDSLTGLVYKDDSQITDFHVIKVIEDGDTTRIELEIEQI